MLRLKANGQISSKIKLWSWTKIWSHFQRICSKLSKLNPTLLPIKDIYRARQ